MPVPDRPSETIVVSDPGLIGQVLRHHTGYSTRGLSQDSFAPRSPATGEALPPELSFIGSAPPRHNRFRALLAPFLTCAAVKRYLPAIDTTILDSMRTLHAQGGGDVVRGLAAPAVACALRQVFGLGPEDNAWVLSWMELAGETNAGSKVDAALPRFEAHMDELWQRAQGCWSRQQPGLLAALMRAHAHGELADTQVLDLAHAVTKGAADTTALLLTSVLAGLHQHPELAAAARHSEAGVEACLWRALRGAAPVQMTLREALSDTTLGEQTVLAGNHLLLLLGAACTHAAPSTNTASLAFGAGAHRCPGAELALALTRRLLATLLHYPADYALVASTAQRHPRPALCGFDFLEIRLASA